jgi:predicted RNA-binding Zn ribbon-like protein
MSRIDFPPPFGGVVCLDFANTLDGRATARPQEFLPAYDDLVEWATFAGLVDGHTAAALTGGPAAAADAALRTAIDLREAIFHVFTAIGRGTPEAVPAAALGVVQDRYADAMAAARLVSVGVGFDWRFSGDAPGRVWWPVALSAARLLTEGPLDRVKVCASGTGCLGLFLDTSKNRSRRWCTMEGCGVDAKVERQARRRRGARPTR